MMESPIEVIEKIYFLETLNSLELELDAIQNTNIFALQIMQKVMNRIKIKSTQGKWKWRMKLNEKQLKEEKNP